MRRLKSKINFFTKEEFKEELIEYVKKLPRKYIYQPSLFWEKLVGDFREELKKEEKHIVNIRKIWRLAELLSQIPPVAFLKRRSQLIVKGASQETESTETKLALSYIKKEGFFEEFKQFFSKTGAPVEMCIIRQFYYARIIENYARRIFKEKKRLKILEIGAGSAVLAKFLYEKDLIKSYCIVDLPEALVSGSLTLLEGAEDAYFGLVNSRSELPEEKDEGIFFCFCPAQYFDYLPKNYFDLVLSFNAFMEMDREVRDHYIRSVYKMGARPLLFINSNRRQTKLPQRKKSLVFDNNPLLYPYPVKEKVLFWGVDHFQDSIRSRLGRAPLSFSILRVGLTV